jgi:hypothetical protein
MAYVLLLRSNTPTNRVVTNNPSDITYINQRLDSFLPPNKRFRVEAYLRSIGSDNNTGYSRSIQVRLEIVPSSSVVIQTGQPVNVVAIMQTANIPQRSYQSTQYSQTGYIINRPTGSSNVRLILGSGFANNLLTPALPYICHLHFIPIEED